MIKYFPVTLIIAFLSPALLGKAYGATIDALSCEQSAVQTAINSASSGDTVRVPAGSCFWSSISIPNEKRIVLQGAGRTSSIITGIPSIGMSGSRITGFTFLNGTTEIYGYGFRFDNNKVQSSTWTDCIKVRDYAPTITQMPSGLIDHNEFINCRVNMEGTPYIYSDDNGANQNRLWALPLSFGGPPTVYLEDNTFSLTYSGNFNAIDANYGGSFVARYNTLYDGLFMETHSSQEGGNRAGKSFEVYGNLIDLRNNYSLSGGMSERWRGGTGLHFYNSYVGNWENPGIPLDNVRSYAPASYGGGLCNGSSAWDGNQGSFGWPCRDQIGRGSDTPQWMLSPVGAYTQTSVPSYFWLNKNGTTNWNPYIIDWSSNHIQPNRDYYAYNSSFNGTSGVGCGTLANRPNACTSGVAYWATNQSCFNLVGLVGANHTDIIIGTLYRCSTTNTWVVHYQPYAYPHPLIQNSPPVSLTPPRLFLAEDI